MFCEALLPGHAPAGAAGQQKVGNTLLLPKIWFSGLISLMELVFSAGSRGLCGRPLDSFACRHPCYSAVS